ncbi:MAG TPA: NAD(P)H-binding protein, partial [Anaerolineales bacterium]|nr:NAD(P)H-binding protein [Anaerolineales bacterium]
MKLAIFGGTGKTGVHVVRKALDAGHDVTALVRDPGKMSVQHERLKVIQGDAMDADAVEKIIAGSDVVLSVLGQSPVIINNILAGMKKNNVKRLAVAAGAGVPDPKDEPQLINHIISFIIKTLSRKVYYDALEQNEIIRASDVDWTICRAPRLVDDPEGAYQVTYVGKEMN